MSICAGTSLNTYDYDWAANQALYELVEFLEVILDCMLIANFQGREPGSASRSALQYQKSGAKADVVRSGVTSGSKFNGLNPR